MTGWLRAVLLVMLYDGSNCGHLHNLSTTSQGGNKDDVTVVKRAAGDPYTRRSPVDKNFIRFGRSFGGVGGGSREKNMMSFARVSRAANENFITFGTPHSDLEHLYFTPTVESATPTRFGRGKDNFMRFGRGKDNFMRFGRGKDNFIRFGRAKDNFMRFGRAKDNFMRFGRAKDNFIRFGRGKENFMRFGRGKDNFMRFGRGKDNFIRFGRAKDNFMRFGKSYGDNSKEPNLRKEFLNLILGNSDEKPITTSKDVFQQREGRGDFDDANDGKIDDDGPEVDQGDLDLQADKPKNGPIIRIKRDTEPTTLWNVEDSSKDRPSRDSDVEESSGSREVGKRSVNPEYWVFDDEPDGVEVDGIVDNTNYTDSDEGRFIRFG